MMKNKFHIFVKKVMKREEKCKLAIEKGYIYNPENGKVIGINGGELKSLTSQGYSKIKLKINKKSYILLSHQFVWYWVHKEIVEEIDHINGVKTDNRIINLRSVTRIINCWNRTKAKGYSWNERLNKWVARIKVSEKTIHLGCFVEEQKARQAYLNAKDKYHKINECKN